METLCHQLLQTHPMSNLPISVMAHSVGSPRISMILMTRTINEPYVKSLLWNQGLKIRIYMTSVLPVKVVDFASHQCADGGLPPRKYGC